MVTALTFGITELLLREKRVKSRGKNMTKDEKRFSQLTG